MSKQKELLDRLRNALDSIPKNARTAGIATRLLEEFVLSVEEIAKDLEKRTDAQVARDLEGIVHLVDLKDDGMDAI